MDTPNTKIKVLEMQMTEFKQENDRQHGELKEAVNGIDSKIDKFFDCLDKKADKGEVARLDDRFWAIVISLFLLLAGIIAAWFKK